MQILTGHTRSAETGIYTINELQSGHLYERPGISIVNSVEQKVKRGKLPLMIANNTGQHYKIRQGAILGQLEKVQVHSIKEGMTTKRQPLNFEELQVDTQHRETIQDLIKKMTQ